MGVRRPLLAGVFAALAAFCAEGSVVRGADPVVLHVHTDKVANAINPFVYGHFFEHIYNGGDNGLWGEMVWNRSFEDLGQDIGSWEVKEGVVAETALAEGVRMFFGDPTWKDYEFTLQARKVRGNEGFMIIPRGVEGDWLWANLGGWNNTGHQVLAVGPQNAEIGQRVPGTIEMNRWYKVRVRNEGRKIQIWLDDQSIIDTTLPEGVNPSGGVGIATWMTAAEFKDFKVTDLKGKVLLQDAPHVPGVDGPGRHWDVFGNAQIHLVKEGAFNDERAVLIKGSGLLAGSAEVGISQEGFCLRKGEAYKGSLYMKGAAGTGKARFTDNGKMIAEIALPEPTGEWKECPIAFTAGEDALDATLQLSFLPDADLMIDQVSLMSGAAAKNGGFRPDIYQAFAALKPTIIRWPGGVYAEQYHWKNGVGAQSQRKKNLMQAWNDYDPNALGTDEYVALCRKIGAEPLLVINTGMHVTGTRNAAQWQPWIQEACEWVEYCNGAVTTPMGKLRAGNGHPEPYKVKYWEIDNELWRSMQTNPNVYAQAVPLFAAAMKKVDPGITIIAHGGNALDRDYDRTLLQRAAGSFNVLSIHHYTDPDKYASGVADQDALYKELIGLIKTSANPEIKLDVSEWNAQTTDWRTGLYAGGILNTFEKYGETLTIAGPALLFRHTSATAWDNAFINFDHKGWFPTPNYVVMKLWREHFAPQRLTVEGDAGKLNLIASKTEKGDQVILKAVNPTDAAIVVSAVLDGGFAAGAVTFELIAPGSLSAGNTMEKPDTVKPAKANATVANGAITFTMPAYSAGIVSIAKAP